MNDMLEFFVVFGIAIAVIFGGIFGLYATVDYMACRGFAKGTGMETRWEWGCYAKVDGKWVPKEFVFGNAHDLRVKQQ